LANERNSFTLLKGIVENKKSDRWWGAAGKTQVVLNKKIFSG